MAAESDKLDDILSSIRDVTQRLDGLQERLDAQEQTLNVLNESGLVHNLINMSSGTNVANACGLDSEKMFGRKPTSLKKKRKQQLGARIYMVYCVIFVALMFLSFEGRLPVMAWEERLIYRTIPDVIPSLVFMRDTIHWPLIFSAIYVVVIFGIQRALKDKKPFDLRTPLACWSLCIGIFSLLGSLRTVPVVVAMMNKHGVKESICGNTYRDWVLDSPAGFWTYLFVLSKVPELIDTLFIVLRKRTLITLHWYHHITVMTFCWNSWGSCCLNGVFYAAMNLTVHAFMYIFYFLAALGYRPTAFAMSITLLQITQMILGTAITCYVNYHMMYIKPRSYAFSLDFSFDVDNPDEHPYCYVNPTNALAGMAMYSSYLWLFCVFFYQAYVSPKGKKEKKA